MSTSANGDSALHQLARAMTASGCHSTAIALRKLAYEGYATLEEVDSASDWVLLSIRGMGAKRLSTVRQLTRRDWKAPSASVIQAANWFFFAAQFALRYWPPKTLAALIQGTAPQCADEGPIDRRLAIDVFAQAVHQALRHCEAEELIQTLRQASGRPGECARQAHADHADSGIGVDKPASRQSAPLASELSATPRHRDGAVEDSDRYAHPHHKRLQIVQDYWVAREKGLVQNKDSWARAHYHISGKTLLSYEREFRD